MFVLSTGRCGTQWLAHFLGRWLGARARVEHEPLPQQYRPRLLAGGGPLEALPAADLARVEEHLAGIETTLESCDYVECGHPAWAAVPHLARRFAGRFGVVHLVRHPVPTACSWLTQQAYEPPPFPHVREKVLLAPADGGPFATEYRDRWAGLTPYEKCLYYWATVHAFALEFEARTTAPWLRVRCEELFDGTALPRLLAFLGYEGAADAGAMHQRVDVHRFQSLTSPRFESIGDHPAVLATAARLGYDPAGCAVAPAAARYWPPAPTA